MAEIEKDSTPREALSPEQIIALNKPLPLEAVSQHPTKAYLSTIKAIYVVERFNQVFGLGGWYINNEFMEKVKATRIDKKTSIPYEIENVVVKSTFQAPKYGITIPDIFGGNDNEDLGDAYKGACTDALTKIGSYLGVGMDVYKGLADKKPSSKPNPAPGATTTPKGDIKATAKQIALIKTLLKQKGQEHKVTPEQVEKLDIGEAKKWIDKLLKLPNKTEEDAIQIETEPYIPNHEGD